MGYSWCSPMDPLWALTPFAISTSSLFAPGLRIRPSKLPSLGLRRQTFSTSPSLAWAHTLPSSVRVLVLAFGEESSASTLWAYAFGRSRRSRSVPGPSLPKRVVRHRAFVVSEGGSPNSSLSRLRLLLGGSEVW